MLNLQNSRKLYHRLNLRIFPRFSRPINPGVHLPKLQAIALLHFRHMSPTNMAVFNPRSSPTLCRPPNHPFNLRACPRRYRGRYHHYNHMINLHFYHLSNHHLSPLGSLTLAKSTLAALQKVLCPLSPRPFLIPPQYLWSYLQRSRVSRQECYQQASQVSSTKLQIHLQQKPLIPCH